MSATHPSAMDPLQAQNLLLTEVHAPIFFQKLAHDYGIEPANQAEAFQLLQMAGKLRVMHEQEMQKTASGRNDFLSLADEQLDYYLQGQGYEPQQTQETEKLAEWFCQQPEIQQAVLSYQDAVASQLLAAQQGSEGGSGSPN